MEFLLCNNTEIIGTEENMKARLKFIEDITGVVPTSWEKIQIQGSGKVFWKCTTNDHRRGAYITVHNFEILELIESRWIDDKDFIIANSCVYGDDVDIKLLKLMRLKNKNMSLWYAKQSKRFTRDLVFRKVNPLSDVGTFGFKTSYSDRLMYKNRKKGFENALELSYEQVRVKNNV